ncbi:MAG: hypothetical protein OXT07_15490 [bacterium]|nr:hypothetical protein [bacterium]
MAAATVQRSPFRTGSPSLARRCRSFRRVVTMSPTRMVRSPVPATASAVSPVRARRSAISALIWRANSTVGALMRVDRPLWCSHQSAAAAAASLLGPSVMRSRSRW